MNAFFIAVDLYADGTCRMHRLHDDGFADHAFGTSVPHSGQTPDSFPVRSYRHVRQWPGGILWSRRQARIVGMPIAAKGIQNGIW